MLEQEVGSGVNIWDPVTFVDDPDEISGSWLLSVLVIPTIRRK